MLKKILLIMCLLVLHFLITSQGQCDGLTSYTVDVNSAPITQVATMTPDIAGLARIQGFYVSQSSSVVSQTVTFYELSDSTLTVTASFAVDLPSGAIVSQGGVYVPFNIHSDYWEVEDIMARKSSANSTVHVTYWYR